MKRAPPLGTLAAVSVPPCASTSWRAIVSPRPVPPESAARWNRSKTRSGGWTIPGPVSVTSMSTTRSLALVPTADRPTSRRVAQGVAQQVGEDLPDAHPIDLELDVTCALDDERHVTRDSDGGDGGNGVLDEDTHGHGFAVQGQPSGLAERQRAEVLDESVERAGLIAKQLEVGIVARVDAVELRLHLGLQHGERRAQLVGDVGEEPAAGRFRCVKAFGHAVERGAERAHGARARRLHARRVVAGADALGALEQFAGRSGESAISDERRHDRRAHHREERSGRPTPAIATVITSRDNRPCSPKASPLAIQIAETTRATRRKRRRHQRASSAMRHQRGSRRRGR